MGIFRKATSISTLGLVSYRNASERSQKVAKQTRNAARVNVVQNMQMIALQREQLEMERQAQSMRAMQFAAQTGPVPPPMMPPGWYADPTDARALCWWDGGRWHPNTKHFPSAPTMGPPQNTPPMAPQQPLPQLTERASAGPTDGADGSPQPYAPR